MPLKCSNNALCFFFNLKLAKCEHNKQKPNEREKTKWSQDWITGRPTQRREAIKRVWNRAVKRLKFRNILYIWLLDHQ